MSILQERTRLSRRGNDTVQVQVQPPKKLRIAAHRRWRHLCGCPVLGEQRVDLLVQSLASDSQARHEAKQR